MKKITTDRLEISYKPLNIPKSLRLMSKLGITENGLNDQNNLFDLLADFIDEAQGFIKSTKIDGKAVKWEDFIDEADSMEVFSSLLNEIVARFSGGDKESKNA
jgi:hypothetical protein